MDLAAAKTVMQYALAVAADNDEWNDQRLGPIHLIKYLYLADLTYASQMGETYSGAPWRFYHYGPYAQEVWEAVNPAMVQLGAEEITFSGIEDDVVRWHFVGDEYERQAIRKRLPAVVSTAVDRAVGKWGSDTAALLDYVYKTEPMLVAAPNTLLNLGLKKPVQAREVEAPLTAKQQKLRTAASKALKEKVAQLRANRPPSNMKTVLETYDDVYFEGIAWLDSMNDEILPHRGVVTFDDSVWDSESRRDRGDD